MTSLLERIQNQGEILPGDPLFKEIHQIKSEKEPIIQHLNTGMMSREEIQKHVSSITGQNLNQSVEISLPFQTDFGAHIRFGKDIFINKDAFFLDLGGIEIEDHVLIGPRVTLLTVNHILEPAKRRGLGTQPIKIRKNAWLGAGVTVLPGVTIGENAVVAANSTVTKGVPADTIVAGIPAKVIRSLA